jgi:hypothetical protein
MSLTVTFMPFHALVALAISSPTFLGDCIVPGIGSVRPCVRLEFASRRVCKLAEAVVLSVGVSALNMLEFLARMKKKKKLKAICILTERFCTFSLGR